MEITTSSKQQVLAALVVGMGASVAHADLGSLQVVESSSNGFEAVVNLSNQATDQVSNVEVVDGTQAGAQANTSAASLLQVSLLSNAGSEDSLNHQIKITGPGSISSEALRFALAVNFADGGRIIRNYEVMPVIAPNANTLLAMTEFEEVETAAASASATTVVPSSVEKPVQIALNKAKTEKVTPLPTDAGLVMGDVKVKSSMGQKLALEIDVASQNIKSADDIQVQVVPDLSLGVVTPEVAMDIATMQYEVVKKGNGRYSVLLTSMVAMSEPILPVKVEITAGGDVMARQYSVLVDPPSMNKQPQKMQQTYLAYDEQQPVFHAKNRSSGKIAKGVKGYQVVQGDTLAGIASQIKAKSPLSEKMRYLRDANPHAFVGDDINKLLAGTTLNFPETWSLVGTPVRQPATTVASSSNVNSVSMVETVAERQAGDQAINNEVTVVDEGLNSNIQMGDEAAPIQELTANQFKAQQLREQLAEQQQAIAAAQLKIDAARQQKEATSTAAVATKDDSMIALVSDINPVLAGGGVAALALVGGGMVLMRRRKQKQEQMFDGDEMTHEIGDISPEQSYSFGLDDVSLDDANYISEVDSLISYGHFDEAVEVLQGALKKIPAQSDLALKLFEVLALMGNSETFQQEAVASQELLKADHNLFEKVTQLALSLNPVPAYFTGEKSNQDKADKDSDLAFGL